MSRIADLLPVPVEVNIGRGTVTVRGLSLEELSRVLLVYGGPLSRLLESAQGASPDYSHVIGIAPEMAVALITMATDSDGQEEDVRKIPGTAQIELLKAIFELTVPDPKKLLSLLLEVSEKIKNAQPPAGVKTVTSPKTSETLSVPSLKEATG